MSSQFRIGRPKYSVALTHGASATTATATDNQNGVLLEAIIKTPAAVDASATVTINILDSDSNVVYTKGSLAANTTTKDLLAAGSQVPISGAYTVQVVFSAAQTVTDTVTTVALLIDRG